MPLAPLCSLNLGGRARFLATVEDEAAVFQALAWAEKRNIQVTILSGGTNVVIADGGYDGLVIRLALRGLSVEQDGDIAKVTAMAGEPWDWLVERTVSENLAGLECLSGIPGLAGATAVQNVGAYGQEISDTVVSVRVLDRATHTIREFPASDCAFSYRDSVFKQQPRLAVVIAVTFALKKGGVPTLRYGELARTFSQSRDSSPGLAEVREAVLALRRGKDMLLDDFSENRHSVGSFFVNPVVRQDKADGVVRRALQQGMVNAADQVPRFAASGERVKLAAAWLVERAGFPKGFRCTHVGISSKHALALVHHGGGTAAELVALARQVQRGVHEKFDIALTPEPAFVGFNEPPLQ